MDTNIEHNGECPDCERLERQLDNERGRHQQSIDTLGGAAERLQAENEKLREALKETCDVLNWHLDNSEPALKIYQEDFFNLTANAVTMANEALSQPKEETI